MFVLQQFMQWTLKLFLVVGAAVAIFGKSEVKE